jgi:uncharacterized protein (TIGR03086 family)
MTDVIDAHARTLRTSAAIVAQAGSADLDRPTPCAGWDLRDLLAHMVGQNYGFAAAVEGDDDPAVFDDRPVGDDPVEDYRASVDRVVSAFAAPDLTEREIFMSVIRGGMTLPGTTVVRVHLVDYVVHGWDVAKTLSVPASYDEDVLQIALEVAEAVPAEARSDDERMPFRPTIATSSADLLDRVVANLGRDPEWTP